MIWRCLCSETAADRGVGRHPRGGGGARGGGGGGGRGASSRASVSLCARGLVLGTEGREGRSFWSFLKSEHQGGQLMLIGASQRGAYLKADGGAGKRSGVECTCCSGRPGTWVWFPAPRWQLIPSVFPVTGEPALSSDLCGHGMHAAHMWICRSTPVHRKQKQMNLK